MPFTNTPEVQNNITKQITSDFIEVISLSLEERIAQNRHLIIPLTSFCSEQVPQISIHDYLQRSARGLEFDETNFIYMLIYLERFFVRTPTDFIHSFNIHRLTFSCLRLAHKWVDDDSVQAASYQRIGGVASAELNKLELDLLMQLNFDLYVSEKDFLATKRRLSSSARLLETRLGKQFMVGLSGAEEIRLQQLLLENAHVANGVGASAAEENTPMHEHAAASSSAMAASSSSSAAATFMPIDELAQQFAPVRHVEMDAPDTPPVVDIGNELSWSASAPLFGLNPYHQMAVTEETNVIRLSREDDRPIKYCATSQQWFYKKIPREPELPIPIEELEPNEGFGFYR